MYTASAGQAARVVLKSTARPVSGARVQKSAHTQKAERFTLCRVAAQDEVSPVEPTEVTEDAVATPEPTAEATSSKPQGDNRRKSSGTPFTELTVGQILDGTVKSVAAYGCFVDVGAESDGLVHISQLAHEYVKNVSEFVTAGQKVKVKVMSIEGNKRLSLTMKLEDAPEGGGDGGKGQRRPTQGRREEVRHELKIGDEVTGKVTRIAAFGAFLELEDGFNVLLGLSEMKTDGEMYPQPRDIVKEGQEIKCWVTKVDGNKVGVTNMSDEDREFLKKQDAGAKTDAPAEPVSGVFGTLLAGFDLSSLPSSGKGAAPEPTPEPTPEPEAAAPVEAAAAPAEEAPAAEAASETAGESYPNGEQAAIEDANIVEPEAAPEVEAALEEAAPAEAAAAAPAAEEPAPVAEEPAAEEPVAEAAAPAEEEAVPQPEAAAPAAEAAAPAAGANITAAMVKALREASGAGMMSCKTALKENNADMEAAKEWLRKKGLAAAGKKAGRVAADGMIVSYIHAGARLGVLCEVNCETDFVARGEKFQNFAKDIAMQIAANADVVVIDPSDVDADFLAKERELEMAKEDILSKPEKIREKIVQGRLDKMCNLQSLTSQAYIKDDSQLISEVLKATITATGENINIRRFVRYNLGEGLEKKVDDFAAEVASQTQAKDEAPAAPAAEEAPKVEEPEVPTVKVDAKSVKVLRDASGAGMMDCKKALAINNNDVDAAKDYLRKKGLASANKKGSRVATEGAVGSYIHSGSGLGVLVEVNCETDFVARGDVFQELVNDMAMQVAACDLVTSVSAEDVDPAYLAKEKEAEMQKEDLLAKPEAIREKIAEGRVNKAIDSICLLSQPFVKDTTVTVGQHLKTTIASLGENIKVRRFTRFKLGDGIEVKEADFAEEVASMSK